MRRDIARELREDSTLCEPATVATLLGLERSKQERKKYVCPQHGGSSLSLTVGMDRTLRVRCFGCDLTGDVITLAAHTWGLSTKRDFRRILAELAALAGRHDLCEALDGRGTFAPAARPTPPVHVAEKPKYPPQHELEALLRQCVRVTSDADCVTYLRGRALDPSEFHARGLGWALPLDADCPTWARIGARSWVEAGYRIVSPAYDTHGNLRSLRAWRIVEGTGPKRIAPREHAIAELVLADTVGVAMLAGECAPRKVTLAEGEPDHATYATTSRPSADIAVLGIVAGSWSLDIAARIPAGCEVYVQTHDDDSGRRYSRDIVESLAHRCAVFAREAA